MKPAQAVVMVEPRDFGFNPDTANDNAFQHHSDVSVNETRKLALAEFWGMAERLDYAGIEVIPLKSPPAVDVPDAVFPNNWFSTTRSDLIVYPMLAANRQKEVQSNILQKELNNRGFVFDRIHDLSDGSELGGVLEGTGVLIFDHQSKDVYASISERCELNALDSYCKRFGYQAYPMRAMTDGLVPVYHTNVLMAIGTDFCVLAEPCLTNEAINNTAVSHLRDVKSDLMLISEEQMVESFCGNILELGSAKGHPVIALSESALKGFTANQLSTLERHGELVPCAIDTIEYVGGGSARCMLAEIFLEKRVI